ncbi:cupredoxin domain-containing protein [Patescibacteria group bacterium]|nr:cupredoxin domain-containing protein [Patescibacteria group bacterium]MBU1907346.1 cupredoxin domain-containing protein [Patescibacteria group bacterium]
MKKILALLIVIAVIILAYFLYVSYSDESTLDTAPETLSGLVEDTTEAVEDTASDIVAEAHQVTVSAFEYGYEPPSLRLPADTPIELTLTNDGTTTHDFVIDGQAIETTRINKGETDTIEFELKRGTYTFYCSVNSHRALGMEGVLIVE